VVLQVVVTDALGVPIAVNRYEQPQSLDCDLALILVLQSLDLTPDGSPEARILFAEARRRGFRNAWVTVDGASGRILDRSAAFLLGGTVDGRGADRGAIVAGREEDTFVAVRGDAVSRRITQTRLPVLASTRFEWFASVAALGGSCDDLVAEEWTTKGSLVRLVGGNGRPRWTLHVDAAHPAGTISLGTGARDLC
jgi:hypothetical protein